MFTCSEKREAAERAENAAVEAHRRAQEEKTAAQMAARKQKQVCTLSTAELHEQACAFVCNTHTQSLTHTHTHTHARARACAQVELKAYLATQIQDRKWREMSDAAERRSYVPPVTVDEDKEKVC